MKITVKNGNVITNSKNSSNHNDYEYASASGDDYEYAVGKSKKTDAAKKEKKTFKEKRKGFGQKIGNAARKVGSAFKKFVGKLKAKKAARKLKREKGKDGKVIHKDIVPSVVPAKINGGRDDGFARPNPDGTTTEFKTSEVEKAANGKTYAAEDLKKEGENTIENGELVKIIPPESVKELTTEDGETIPFHKDDVIDKDAPDDSKPGMSTTKKILIGSAILVGVGLAVFTVYKLTKKGK